MVLSWNYKYTTIMSNWEAVLSTITGQLNVHIRKKTWSLWFSNRFSNCDLSLYVQLTLLVAVNFVVRFLSIREQKNSRKKAHTMCDIVCEWSRWQWVWCFYGLLCSLSVFGAWMMRTFSFLVMVVVHELRKLFFAAQKREIVKLRNLYGSMAPHY